MTKRCSIGIAATALLFTGIAVAETPVPELPEDVSPLPVGSTVPSVSVARPDGSKVDLAVEVEGKPTILIFYRGGW